MPPITDINTPAVIEVLEADFAKVESLAPPQNVVWQKVALPDSWRQMQRKRQGYGWYRFTVQHNGDDNRSRAFYIPRITNNIELFLNGSPFVVSGRLGPNPEKSWNFAQYYEIPRGLLHKGNNEILVRLHPDGYPRAGLSRVYFGDSADLGNRYRLRRFAQTGAPTFITGLTGLVGLFALAIWAKRRAETVFGFFGLMSLVAVVRLVHYFLREVPDWLALLAVPSICWVTVLQMQFALRFAGTQLPRFEKSLVVFAIMATIALFALPWKWYASTTMTIYAGLALLSPVILYVLGRETMRRPSAENLFMYLAIVVNVALGVHDFLNYQELLGFDRLYLMPFGLPLMLLAVAALLVKRFVNTLSSYEQLNLELAGRVAQREAELGVSYERARSLDQQRATAEERQRLMRDMHDGIGSHLMSTLALARVSSLSQHQMEETLTDCIDELKLTIDSLESVESDLLVVLGNLRYRLEPRLQAAGISLEWAVSDLPPLAYLDPQNVRSVLRIIQEAFTNTLKHAHANRITLSTGVDFANARVFVRVTDDGVGLDSSKPSGRGLDNMKNRAAKLHGELEIVSLKGGGTCVNLYLPLAKMA